MVARSRAPSCVAGRGADPPRGWRQVPTRKRPGGRWGVAEAVGAPRAGLAGNLVALGRGGRGWSRGRQDGLRLWRSPRKKRWSPWCPVTGCAQKVFWCWIRDMKGSFPAAADLQRLEAGRGRMDAALLLVGSAGWKGLPTTA
ncbi:hypothetical protein NDU88_004268 [Pleurodeles waltl]|uniref:Uncharacterized protein n=1 Tax=Pleurodeles waltl TaxID=8319 RepID=A0AAV7L115_PLEWA|nr:hypothetical protein NDU88_004268 [Pleurodeles waltl]